MAGRAGVALLLLASLALQGHREASAQQDAFQHDRPGRPSVDAVHVKSVGVACSSPYTLTQLTSPVFDSYLAALSKVSTTDSPLLFSAKCGHPWCLAPHFWFLRENSVPDCALVCLCALLQK